MKSLTLETAIEVACRSHINQKDKGGHPYILHPLRVMMKMPTMELKIVAVLHDVLEDTDLMAYDLNEMGASSNIIDALVCLTRKDKETYSQYIERVKTNDYAIAVKLADLVDNCDLNRIPNRTSTDLKRVEKYLKAYDDLFMIYLKKEIHNKFY